MPPRPFTIRIRSRLSRLSGRPLETGPASFALGRFPVVLTGFGRRTPPRRNRQDVDDEPLALPRDLQPVARLHHARCLYSIAVHLHVPAVDGLLREAAGLEKPGAPEPFVDSKRTNRATAAAGAVLSIVVAMPARRLVFAGCHGAIIRPL